MSVLGGVENYYESSQVLASCKHLLDAYCVQSTCWALRGSPALGGPCRCISPNVFWGQRCVRHLRMYRELFWVEFPPLEMLRQRFLARGCPRRAVFQGRPVGTGFGLWKPTGARATQKQAKGICLPLAAPGSSAAEVQPRAKQARPPPSPGHILVRGTANKMSEHDHRREEGRLPGEKERPGDRRGEGVLLRGAFPHVASEKGRFADS